jgi:hypothetical protein
MGLAGEVRGSWLEAAAGRGWSRAALAWVTALMLGSVAMQFSTWNWFVEDAAISVACADNLAAGDGLVA